ncbi:hypothetical protein FA95DRAFT_1591845 [Auriscalpium vulgare]|uniref:Uncharacterized protein n=1 Tax=Auriscalpium vulgare TaxID=40419 RepID=A0ACB8SDU0_9AGAM|nr:hypothetical protein FA95DRAFT_1591845 [Auriscalpium vulgare]
MAKGSNYLGPPKERRCNYFEADGKPAQRNEGLGCPRTAAQCNFIHPTDPQWDWTRPPPKYKKNWDSGAARRVNPKATSPSSSARGRSPHPQRMHRSSRSPQRRSSRSLSPRRRSRSRTRSERRRSPSPRRRRSPSPRRRSPSPRRHRESNYGHRESDYGHRESDYGHRDPASYRDERSRPFANSDKAPLSSPTRQTSVSSSVPTTGPRAIQSQRQPSFSASSHPPTLRTSVDPGQATVPTPSTVHPPSHAPVVSQLPVTATLPPAPQPLRAPPPVAVKELTMEEKRVIWAERINLSALAVTERLEHVKLEKDVIGRRRLTQSSGFQVLSGESKANVLAQLRDAEAKSEEKKKSLVDIISRLVDAGFWPIQPHHDLADFDAKISGMKTSLGTLYNGVAQLNSNLTAVMNPSQLRQGQADHAGAVGPEARPLKRQRTLTGETIPDEDDSVLQSTLELMQDRVQGIENRAEELQNDLTQHMRDTLDEFEGRLDDKVEEITAGIAQTLLTDGQIGPAATKQLSDLEMKYSQADEDMDEMAKEVGELIVQLRDIQANRDRLVNGNTQLREGIAELDRQHKGQSEELEQMRKEMHALSNVVKAALAAPRTQPVQPPIEVVVEAIKEPVQEIARKELHPALQEFRTQVEDNLHVHGTSLRDAVGPKLAQYARSVEVIWDWIEQGDPSGIRRPSVASTT